MTHIKKKKEKSARLSSILKTILFHWALIHEELRIFIFLYENIISFVFLVLTKTVYRVGRLIIELHEYKHWKF